MFDAHLAYRARLEPRTTALITNLRRVSYAEFDADVSRVAAALLDLGLRPGPVAALRIGHGYLQYLALMALGRIGVCSSVGYDHGADLNLTDLPPGDEGELAGKPALRLPRGWLEEVLAAPVRDLPRPDVDPDALGRVLLSSGTTRKPRRVGLTWRRIEAGIHGAVTVYAHRHKGVWIPLTSPESMLGHSQVLSAFSLGAAVLNGVAIPDLPPLLEALEPGILSLTPSHLRQLLTHLPEDFSPRPGWMITAAGTVLPLGVAREARLRITPDVRIIYGATEAGLSATGPASGLETAPNLLGWVPPGAEAEVVDDDGQPVPDGQQGELRVRGERTVSGYLDDPDGTAERFRGGWFYTRDLVRRLPDGRLVIDGRVDDRMNLSGLKILPTVLENPASECPGVLDVAAFAVPDPQGFDHAWLAVVAAPDFERESLLRHLARYRDVPTPHFAWIDEIPRNAMGKVERAKLSDAVLALTRGGA
ncbi:MAG: acyl--CoA ligase [Caulobacterales bacterium]|nr:acyl--CoA ligase [Caulobacterales bacterium]